MSRFYRLLLATAVTSLGCLLFAGTAAAQSSAERTVLGRIDARADEAAAVARTIWGLAEVGYQETRSSALLADQLRAAGFTVESGVAGIPTAWVATWGTGGPVIGILAEYDALPGISQDTVPERKILVAEGAGHACGHHLFGTASVEAGIAVKEWLVRSGRPGRVRVYGTPAEEGGGGKVYMVRAGLFDDVDVVIQWHPWDRNDARAETSLANISGKFRFKGLSSHASVSPEKGRSALDGVEAMNHMVNLLREHIPQEARIHYVITQGGRAPNVVPDFAEVYYYARHPLASEARELWGRIRKAAEGAALGTGTSVEGEILNGVHSILINETLARVMDAKLRTVGGVRYSPEERAFAERLYATLTTPDIAIGSEAEIQPFGFGSGGGSTDVGDVSWVAPTVGLSTATWVPGTTAHSWQAVAAGGTGIGFKGMAVAAKTMALMAVELYQRPELIRTAREEFNRRRGPGFVYESLVGDRSPPLDYRK